MKFRFSLRWLLVATATVALLLYLIFIHPTLLAEQFIRSVENHDYRQLEPICQLANESSITDWTLGTRDLQKCTVKARLVPRSWEDLLKMRRVMWIDLRYKSTSGSWWYTSMGGQMEYYEAISAGLSGVKELDIPRPPEALDPTQLSSDDSDDS